MDENRRPSTHAVTVQTTIAQTPTTTAAQSTTTIKREDDAPDQEIVSIRIKPEHDSFVLSDLPAFDQEDNGIEDTGLEKEDIPNAPKIGQWLNLITKRKPDSEEDVPMTNPNEDSGSNLEPLNLKTRKRQKTKTGWANTAATTTTATKLRPETTIVLSTKQIFTQIFSSKSPHAHSDVHTYPLPPDQPHRHSYHSPLLLSFPGGTESSSAQDSIAAARKHRDALLKWFDKYCAARQMPWRKPWVDPSPLLCPANVVPSTSAAITTASASASASKPTTSSSKPTSNSLVGPKVKASPPIPDSVLLFPNLAAYFLRAQAEAEAQEQQTRAEAEARARAQAEAEAEAASKALKQAQTLQTLRSTISQRFYEVLLSEIERQIIHEPDHERTIQRRAKHYNRWIKALPAMEDLAKAGEKEVEGLSKSNRVGYFHKAAKLICDGESNITNNTAGLPNTVEQLQELPGVGPHNAGVVAAVVFGRAEPMVDWNVTRVLARQLGIRGDVTNKEIREVIWEAARRLVVQVAWDGVEAEEEAKATRSGSKKGKRKDMNEGENVVDMGRRNRGPPPLSDRPGRWGQALMELGAAVCLLAQPACGLCPIQATCRAYAEGLEIAREKGLVVGNKATREEKDRQALKERVEELQKQKVVDIEDAACTLCPPPSLRPSSLSPNPGHLTDASAKKIKKENQDEANIYTDTDTDTDVHYLGTVPKTAALPSTKENTQNTQTTTQDTQTNKAENNTISTTFYERNGWLRNHVDDLKRSSKPEPQGFLGLLEREFITTYCRQYPYTKPKPERKTTAPRFSRFKYQPNAS